MILIKFNLIFALFNLMFNFAFYKITIPIRNNNIMSETKKRLPLQCPACEAPLKVGRLFCEECNTEVCGSFELPLLARLTEKEQQFVLDFVKSSGSLKDMAKNIGVSYPTVRNILDDLIDKLTKMDIK